MSGDEAASFDPVFQARLDKVVDSLEEEFDGIHERAHIAGLVDESARQLSRGNVDAFVAVLSHRFSRERLQAEAQRSGALAKTAPSVVFVSLLGGGRAQMGAGLLARRCGNAVTVHSAGSQASADIDANVRAAMAELGIDLSDEFTRPLTREVLAGADYVVTLGRSVGEVDLPEGPTHVDWRVGDPAGAELDEVRRVRDDLARRVEAFAAELLG